MDSPLELEVMLASAIAEDNAKERREQNQNKLRITEGAYAKIKLYAELTSRIAHTGMECYGYLLRPKWSTDDLITNVYFADDQVNSAAHTLVPVEGIRKAVEAVDAMDCEIVGWWHSHGNIDVFHSGTDVENFRRILNGISPHTIFRNEEAPYVVDEDHRRVVFEDYALTDLTPEELQIFKDRQIRAVKKVSQDPFAFSMVVNNRQERYLERLTKSRGADGEFRLNNPIHPQFQTVRGDNDLEFLVADVEWEVRQKIILNGHSQEIESWQEDDALIKTVDDFVNRLLGYIRNRGKHAQYAFNMLFGNSSNVYDQITAVRIGDVAETERKGYTIKAKNGLGAIKERLIAYFNELSEEGYSAWRQKIHTFDRQHILAMRFMQEFCQASATEANGEKVVLQDKIFEKYHDIALRLNNSCEVADRAMKAMTKYAMETMTDYQGQRGHNYRNLIGSIITKMCGEGIISFENAAKAIASTPGFSGRKKIYIWEDRFGICDQLTIDAYQLKSGSIYNRPELAAERRRTVGFLEKFAELYEQQPDQIDGLIEREILQRYGVADKKYCKFQDSEYCAQTYQRPQTRIFQMYRPRPASPVQQKAQPTVVPSTHKTGLFQKPGFYKRWKRRLRGK